MSSFVVIREYIPSDAVAVSELLRNAYLSNVFNSWCIAVTKEITFQLIVMFSAILFIFVGVPLYYCVISIPLVLTVMYVSIYSASLMKVMEIMHSKKPLHSWVAEVYEPLISLNKYGKRELNIIPESKLGSEGFITRNCRRTLIGTIAVGSHLHLEDTIWLFRFAILPNYQQKGLGQELIKAVRNWCYSHHYKKIELALSECQENSRQVFVDLGFDLKQLYHKQILGSALTLLMYHLVCDLKHSRIDL